ncbi:hypothetical protein SDC9_130298 [bioreactor metagenome]|uniref:Phage holin family protein n=2 Tax=root TaxID=1 RepID=A0A1W1IIX3_9LACT|nr:phage holin family protein [Trichococcus pasteurii]SFE84787.1 putative membrane protein [Trichococcus pasteurii]SLM52998.1 Hypothetical protein TPAS_2707 [Trichococcus pasteurii]SSB93879.1 Hypothetical protein TPAS_2707 [Trichococcus pasteurii]
MGFWKKAAVNSLVFIGLAYFMAPSFYVHSLWTAFWASIVLGIVNFLIKPVLSILSFPITILTFGLFSFVINGFMLYLTSWLVGPGFHFTSYGTAFLVALIMSVVHMFLSRDVAH